MRIVPLSSIVLVLLAAAPLVAQEPEARRFLPGPVESLPFSSAVLAGDTLYVSGTLGLDPETGAPPDDPSAEARLIMEQIGESLSAVGMTFADVVSVQVFCPELELYATFNAVYRTYFVEGAWPARAFIGSGPLLRGARFEVTAVAVRR